MCAFILQPLAMVTWGMFPIDVHSVLRPIISRRSRGKILCDADHSLIFATTWLNKTMHQNCPSTPQRDNKGYGSLEI